MALNIKNDETHRLARRLAELRDTSITEAVTQALRATVDAEARGPGPDLLVREVAEIQAFLAEIPDRDTRATDEILGYDGTGLPT